MPWLPSSASSPATTSSIGISGRPTAGGSSPTCTCRPRGRRLRIELPQVTAAPRASRETCAPPPVSSATVAGTSSAVPSTPSSAPNALASSSAQAATSTATTRAPAATATWTAESPTPPQPCTATHSPGTPCPTPGTAPEGGGEPAAQAGRGRERHPVGERHQVHVSGVQRDELGQRAPVGEARLGLVQADLPGAVPTRTTSPAGTDERHRHPVTDPPPAHPVADRGHRAGQLVAGDVGNGDVRVVAGPGVPVAAADPAGRHPDDHAARRGGRLGHRLHRQRTAELLEDQRTHDAEPALRHDEPCSRPVTGPLTRPRCAAG